MSTEILGVNELDKTVAVKYPTYNEGKRQQEAQLTRALSATVTAPPGGEAEGDTFIIPVGATGDWAGLDNQVAHFWAGRYDYHPPFEGMKLQVVDDQVQTYVYDGTAWVRQELPTPAAISISSVAGVVTIDIAADNSFPYYYLTMTEAVTDVQVSGGQTPPKPTEFWLEVTSDGANQIAWPSNFRWSNDTPPTLSVTPGNVDVYRFVSWNGYVDILSHVVTLNA